MARETRRLLQAPGSQPWRTDIAVDRHLAILVGHGESLPDFTGWFTRALRSIELEGSEHDIELAARIENRLGGYSSGHISVEELLADLRDDAAEFGIEVRQSSAA